MRFAALGVGCFLFFALAFNGGIGPFYTQVALLAAFGITLAGLLLFGRRMRYAAFGLAVLSFVAYCPVIYQRFTWVSGPDWPGFVFDVLYVAFLAIFIHTYRPTWAKRTGRAREGLR